jgi:hypothetical protein
MATMRKLIQAVCFGLLVVAAAACSSPNPNTCAQVGDSCNGGNDCCSGSCGGGTCQCTNSGSCDSDGDCCGSGTCSNNGNTSSLGSCH